MGVKIRWLEGIKQPSRLTCSVYLLPRTAPGHGGIADVAPALPFLTESGGSPAPHREQVHAVLTLYTGDVMAAPRCPVVVPWESGSSGRFRD